MPKPIRKAQRTALQQLGRKVKYYIRIRTYDDSTACNLWIEHRKGAATSCVLYGNLLDAKDAEPLLKAMALPVVREHHATGAPD